MNLYLKVMNVKKYMISIFVILFLIMLMIYSQKNIMAAKYGLSLWANSVVPSLFPFFVATEILCHTQIINSLGKILEKPIHKIFHVPGEGAFAIVMGTICGYPSGAKIVANLKSQDILSIEEAERLIAFSNNSGPLFILGTVGISMLDSSKLGYILLISHILSCLLVGIVFRNWKYNKNHLVNRKVLIQEKKYNNNEIGAILSSSIQNSIVTILNIGGFIVLFSVILSIFNSSGLFDITGNIFEHIGIFKNLRKFNFIWSYRINKWSKSDEFIATY